MFTSEQLQKIRTEARPLIEQQMDIALQLAAMRDVVATAGGDWSALKAVIKAEIQDKVAKVRDKAESTLAYADMLGLGNLNEKNSFAEPDHDPETGEITEPAFPASAGAAADVGGGENAPVLHVDTNSEALTLASDADGSNPAITTGGDDMPVVPASNNHRVMSMTPLEPRTAGGLKGFGFTVSFDEQPVEAGGVQVPHRGEVA